MEIGPQQALSKHSYTFREGIDLRLPPFGDYSSAIRMKGYHVSGTRHSAAIRGIAPDPEHLINFGLFVHCALFLFVASDSLFIGAALLLAGI
ncbi:hypothetical protein [Microvirga soli]|uniref:hypothetical protein n=1 Tax=Microvirga soli TaxID=1854496 RepID=UPI00191FF3B5|nr:hypothetical protein [Microvirga soli]